MFCLTVLGSGSAGNSAVLTTPACRLLIDCGLSARQTARRLEEVGIDPASLDGIIVTHEHVDHVGGLPVFCRKFDLPVYATSLTAEILRSGTMSQHRQWKLFQTGTEFCIKDVSIQAFSVPHDAVEPVGFVFHAHNASVGFLTDLGYATNLALERLRDVQTLLIETNHDEKMLQDDTKRPWSVKQRILSRHGHLSNAAAANVVAKLEAVERVVLGHLSRDCNSADLALQTMREKLAEMGRSAVNLWCADQTTVSPQFQVAQRVFREELFQEYDEVKPVQQDKRAQAESHRNPQPNWQALNRKRTRGKRNSKTVAA